MVFAQELYLGFVQKFYYKISRLQKKTISHEIFLANISRAKADTNTKQRR